MCVRSVVDVCKHLFKDHGRVCRAFAYVVNCAVLWKIVDTMCHSALGDLESDRSSFFTRLTGSTYRSFLHCARASLVYHNSRHPASVVHVHQHFAIRDRDSQPRRSTVPPRTDRMDD